MTALTETILPASEPPSGRERPLKQPLPPWATIGLVGAIGLASTGTGSDATNPAPPRAEIRPEPDGEREALLVRARRALVQQALAQQAEELYSRRIELVRRRLAGALAKPEEMELRYIEWKLDRIEDARGGEALDRLEQFARVQEQLASTMTQFVRVTRESVPPRPSRRRAHRS